uniref:EGF-like domain-containing protein n=1 Tax=Panagrolaimus sp. PS1159 TaxID=55785 RepID=A0AC35FHE4_9BILA
MPILGDFLVYPTTEKTKPSEKWTQKSLNFLSSNGISEAEILLKYRITCTKNHFGKSCNKICIPPADGSYTCDTESGARICGTGCLKGWKGESCEQCIPLEGCQGSCTKPNECICPPGLKGKFCNESIYGCSQYCKNGGTCSLTRNFTTVCKCPPGFSGQQCEKRVSSCEENPCHNNGKCKMDNSSLTGFVCECKGDYAGQFCQVQAKTCRDLPCKNGAPCLEGNDGYFCECTNNWEGKICDIPLTFCRADSCLNGAECEYVPSTARGFTCKCAPGFYGERCENKISDWKVCRNHKCQNNGNCYRNLGKPACNCSAGFGGEHCEKDLCQCLNGGICDRNLSSHKCICPEGFEGDKCQLISFRTPPRKISSLQDPQSSTQSNQTTFWPFLGIIFAFMIFTVGISFVPKYIKFQKSRQNLPTTELLPTTSSTTNNHRNNEFKQLELQKLPTTKISSSFCSSAPPGICCPKSTCICTQSSSLRNCSTSTAFENQYTLDPSQQHQHQRISRRPSTPEPLREAERRFSQKNLVSPTSSTTSSNEYEDIVEPQRPPSSLSTKSTNYHESV